MGARHVLVSVASIFVFLSFGVPVASGGDYLAALPAPKGGVYRAVYIDRCPYGNGQKDGIKWGYGNTLEDAQKKAEADCRCEAILIGTASPGECIALGYAVSGDYKGTHVAATAGDQASALKQLEQMCYSHDTRCRLVTVDCR